MAIDGVNRYADLIKSIVAGNFYASRGTVLPYRHGNTEIRLKTSSPSTQYGLYVNEVYSGSVTSDVQGNVVFSRHLQRGDNEFVLSNLTTGHKLSSWVTVREYALWLIADAEVFEGIDDDWQEAKDDLAIETATANGIEEVFGAKIGVYNNLSQDLDTYRWTLHELRNAYRDYGGIVRGVETAIAEFTQIPPFGYTRRFWGPNWVLNQANVANPGLLSRSAEISYAAAGIAGVSLESVEADVVAGIPAMRIEYEPTTNSLRWGTLAAWGPWIEANDGELFLPGPEDTQDPFILGLAAPFTLTAFVRYLYLNIGAGTVTVDLSTVPGYPNPSVAQLVAFINAAMGVVITASYNAKLLFTYNVPWIQIEPGAATAAPALFGVKPGDLVFDPSPADIGETIRNISGQAEFAHTSLFEHESDNTVTPPVHRLRWSSPGGAWPPALGWVTVTGDGTYTLTDALGYVMTVGILADDLPVYGPGIIVTQYGFFVNYEKKVARVAQTQGAWVAVDTSQLPAINTTDNVDVEDDSLVGDPETPDDWVSTPWTGAAVGTFEPSRVVTDRLEPLDPSTAFRYHFVDAGSTGVSFVGRVLRQTSPMTDRGSLYPQKNPGLLYDYEGFKATFSGWFLSHDATAVNVVLSFSFDGGLSWVSGAATAIATDVAAAGIEPATFVEFSTIIPAAITQNSVLARATFSLGGAGLDISMDDPRVDIEYITSRVLGNATVPRYRHRQFFGELLFLWSPDALTTVEKTYLGLRHKEADREALLAGARIVTISEDTDAGQGTFEYEYNRIGDLRRFRWHSAAGTWGAGLGWVSILSDGLYQLPATDGSFLEVEVVYDLLPILAGTPPAATQTKTLNISDNTVDQGRVRDIAPAHSSLDIIDVTEYDSNGIPLNLKGLISEADFSVGTLTNMEIEASFPFRYSFLKPTVLPVVGEALTFSAGAPHVATLLYESDQDMDEAILLEDGIPFPNDLWQFNTWNEIQIINPADYDSSATYTFNYNPVYQLETPFINLGAPYQDYCWLADYMLWDRMEHNIVERVATVPIFFNKGTRRAALDRRSNMEQAHASLYFEGADETREISPALWRFIDAFTVDMDSSQYVQGAQYFLTYEQSRLYVQSGLTVLFEHRSGASVAACTGAAWAPIQRNENVDVNQAAGGHVIHQLRLSISSIRDLRDFRLRSLVLKGLHLFGANPNVEGLTNV